MSSVEIKIPALGESITEAVIGKFHKKAGDTVAADEPIAVLETDKVTIDVQAAAAGVIASLTANEGDKVKIGDVIGTIDSSKAGASAPKKADGPAEKAPEKAAEKPAEKPAEKAAAPKTDNGQLVTPTARAVAADKGIDTSTIQGSGAQGRVMKEDVLKAAEGAKAPAASTTLQAPTGPRAEERVKMTPLRKRVAERLLQAQNTAAILTTFNEVDMSNTMRIRKEYGERFEKKHGVKLGFMSFFVKAAIEALKTFPAVNASIDGEEVVFHHYYDIGVAVSGSRGLVVPVLRDADQKSMAEIEKTIAELGVKAKNDKLQLSDLQGGTFTISNGGIFGSMLSTPILNPPQTGILGMHNIQERAVVRDGQIVARPMMYLALSYDHRLIDGREAVQFLVRIKDCLEAPERILLEM
ncbi:MAG: dihydrolipoamide succinyltransferase [Archangium gephyra]|uniref:Dihydrolipoyllysine-residue succinyltransferase component of 2-oxoglutarate dehydrogenase complex n=1 Tax=Archangium gephyra TaxID=48 RepID=A0A2W5T982_9BACT|nr:MAG: dihydrolipoamide succinyltransferase [Archangium gephyra]